MRWFFPSWNGDFRLEVGPQGYRQNEVVLEVTKPSAGERALLEKFLDKCKKKGHLDAAPELIEQDATETQRIAFKGSIGDIGTLLKKTLKPGRQVVTAISSTDGQIKVVESGDAALPKYIERAAADATAKKGIIAKVKETVAATVTRPTLSCPDCLLGAVPMASEVLLAFLSEEEHRSWAAHRHIIVTGGYSGHRYLLAHRHSARAVQQKRICYDLDDRFVLKFYDWSVPPEEEVLAAKLLLEHREDWVRNEASCFSSRADPVFKNPFGDYLDGTRTARALGGIGGMLLGSVGKFHRIVPGAISIETSNALAYGLGLRRVTLPDGAVVQIDP